MVGCRDCPFLVQAVWRYFPWAQTLRFQPESSGFLNFYIQRTSRPVVGVLIVQTPHSCLQDLLPTSTYQSYLFLFAYLQASCRSSHLVQTPHLCLQDSLPTSACRDILNAHLQASCRSFHLSKHLTCVSRTYSQLQPVEILQAFQKHVVSGNQLTSHFHQMT